MKKILSLTLCLFIILSLAVSANLASDELPVEGWKVHVSSQNSPGGTPREKGENVLDGDTVSHWHSSIEPKAEGPHFITIELPEITAIGGYRYYPRQGGGAGVCTEYAIYLSNDNENFQKVAEGTWENNDSAKTAEFTRNYNAKFVRLQFVAAHMGFGSAGEIRIIRPKSGSAPLDINPTVKGSEIGGIAASSQTQTPAAPAAGENIMNLDYITTEKVSGEALNSDELSPKDWLFQVSSVNSPKGIPHEKPENVIDGDKKSHWHSAIDPKAEGPHYFTIILPGETEFGGLRYYPREGLGAGVCTKYELYISNDNENFEKVAEGTWENTEDAKTAAVSANYKAKYVRLQFVSAVANYGSAGEIRLLAPVGGRETKTVTNANVKRATLAAKQVATVTPAVSDKNSTVLSEDELSVEGWTFDASSINANNGKPNEVPERTIDGDLQSHWHSMINPKAPEPHYITIILPEEQVVSGYRYYPRKDGGAGICTDYEIHVSPDGETFKKVAEGSWGSNTNAKTVNFTTNIKAKAVKLVIVRGKDAYGSAGEIRLIKEDTSKKTVTATELIESADEFSYVAVSFPGISVKTDKPENQSSSLMIDGHSESFYHSEITNSSGRLPVTIDFNFGYPYTISGFSYLPRLDENLTGHFNEIEVEYSLDGENYEFINSFVFDNVDESLKSVILDEPIKAKYMRVIVTKGHGNYATCAEFKFLQTEGDHKREAEEDDVSYVLQIGSKDIHVKKEGKEYTVTTDVAPFIFKNYTMIPLRGLLEQMGASVNWIEYDQKIEVMTERDDYMLFQIEEDRVYINDTRYNAQVAPIIKEGRTFIPLRFVSENMGYTVGWDGETQTITISNE